MKNNQSKCVFCGCGFNDSEEIKPIGANRVIHVNCRPSKIKTSKCEYCGKDNGSPDENLLCAECREGFGHSLYSEL